MHHNPFTQATLAGRAWRSAFFGGMVATESAHPHLFSAKGAGSYQPGATPQENAKPPESGLKARPTIPMNDQIPINRAFSALHGKRHASWGVAPGWNNAAPLALNASARLRAQQGELTPPHHNQHSNVSMRFSMRSAHRPRINRPTADRRHLLHQSPIAPSASESGAMPSDAGAMTGET